MEYAFLAALAILVLFAAGCGSPNPAPEQQQQAPQNEAPQQEQQGYVAPGQEDTGGVKVAASFACNDEAITTNILSKLGEGYSAAKAPPTLGKTFNAANCFVKRGNVSIITYTLQAQLTPDEAMKVLEDEKTQYEQQLFDYTYDGSTIGSKGYLFDQPVQGGSLYRLIFIDDTNDKVVVFIKSNSVVEKDVVETVGEAIAEVV